MTGIRNIEVEFQKEISSWDKIIASPPLLIIVQKIQLFIQDHRSMLDYFLQHKQISAITLQHNIIGTISRELHEKLKYCSTPTEIEHCIMSYITAICCLKNNFYGRCQKMAAQLNLPDAVSFLKTAAENEARIWKWTIEQQEPFTLSKKNHYLLL